MDRNRLSTAPTLPQRIHEATLSLNVASVTMAFFWLSNPRPATSLLLRMDIAISRYLRILPDLRTVRFPKDSYIGGYFAFFLPALALALCIWTLLRVFSRARLHRQILESFGGIVALAALPIYWLCATYSSNHRSGWNPFSAIQFYELLVVLICASLYLRSHWHIPMWGSLLVILLHYAFWFQQFDTYYIFRGNGGSITLLPIIGLMSALAWILYTSRARLRSEAD
jgi:hypothetical protein